VASEIPSPRFSFHMETIETNLVRSNNCRARNHHSFKLIK
jgi:hypothetical protein